VIAIALSPERQDHQNVRKLRGLRQGIGLSWSIRSIGINSANLGEIKRLLDLDELKKQRL
jgi:hypothetical protein